MTTLPTMPRTKPARRPPSSLRAKPRPIDVTIRLVFRLAAIATIVITAGILLALLIRDLRLATRAGGGFGLGLAFFLIVCTLVPFGVGPEGGTLALIAPGILWVGALLACLLSLDRIFALDWEDGSLDLLATAPLPMEGAVLVKAAAHWITTGLPLVVGKGADQAAAEVDAAFTELEPA